MQFQFLFKHMESSPALSSHAEAKLRDKIQKFVTKPIEAMVTFSVERQTHTVHCSIRAGDGFNIDVDADSPDMYATVDILVDKLESALKRQKEKLKSHKVKPAQMRIVGAPERNNENSIDADDILKYERARMKMRKVSSS